ncbi:MAG: uroporphyrinogen-III synthase [Steroidobacteraceae bacterium]
MLPLDGVGVLITRPAHQAAPLSRLFEAAGATTARLPAIDIRPLADTRTLAARLGAIENFGLIIFASANAVRYGAALLDQRRDLPLAAIGPATARALNQAGYRVSVQPLDGFDSESLLRHAELSSIAGRRVLLVKGEGGRGLLEQELTRRGAVLTLAEVYRRECAAPAAEELRALESRFERHEIHVITATSAEIGGNLLALATPALRRQFDAAHWLVPSARVADLLRQAGLKGPIVRAASAEDQDLVAAVVRWRSTVSGA